MANFDFNNIEKYLREGGNPETIANAFADKMNLILAVMNDENALTESAEKVCKAWNDYVVSYFKVNSLPANSKQEDWYISVGEVKDIMDLLVRILPVINKSSEFISAVEKEVKKNTKTLANNTNDIWKEFFNNIL